MKAKEKAKELLDKFIPMTKKWDSENGWMNDQSDAQSCAIIVVNEILMEIESQRVFERIDYWEQVKTEIEKL